DVDAVVVTGTGGNNVTLEDSGATNDIGDTTYDIATGGNATVTVTQAADDILIGLINAGAGGTVSLTATAGAIEESAVDGAVDIVAGGAVLDGDTGIGAADDIETTVDSLTFNSAGAVQIAETDAVALGGTLTAASLNLAAGAAITDAAATSLTVTSNATLSGTNITLGDNGADTTNFGSLTFNATGTVFINEDSA